MLIPGHGPKDARLVIVGEAPGATEEQRGIPFVGRSGELLDSTLKSCGIERSQVYVTNVVKQRPFKNDFGIFYHDKSRTKPKPELLAWRNMLHEELRQINPNAILLLGREALKALHPHTSIDHWRGSILCWGESKSIPCFHPAFVLRQPDKLPIFKFDVSRAVKQSASRALPQNNFEFIYCPSLEVIERELAKVEIVSLDIETFEDHIRCLGIGLSPTKAMCIPFFTINPRSNWYSEAEERRLLDILYCFLLNPSKKKIAHNFQFDLVYLEKEFGLETQGLIADTMLLSHTAYSELPKGLDFISSIYTEIPYWSEYNANDDAELWKYNCIDCIATYQCYAKLLEIVDNSFYFCHVHPLALSLARMGNRGVLIDIEARKKLREDLITKQKETKAKLGIDFNPDSPKQLCEYLYTKLKLPTITNIRTKKPTTDKKALTKLAENHEQARELLKNLLEYKATTKLISSFIDTPLDSNSRLRTDYKVAGTVTGRISSARTVDGVGGNLQQIPKGDFRKIFIPEPGFIWVKADLEGAEARVVAWLSRSDHLIKSFSTDPDFDIHKWMASKIYDIPISSVTKTQRQIAKIGVHGGNYGLKPKAASLQFGVSLADARRSLSAFHQHNPRTKLWWKEVEEVLKKTRTLTTPLGRRRVFFSPLNEQNLKSAYAFQPQSIICDIIGRAIIKLDSILPPPSYLALQVHDEIDLIVKKDDLEKVLIMVKQSLEQPIIMPGVEIPMIIPAEVSYGPNWAEQEKVKWINGCPMLP